MDLTIVRGIIIFFALCLAFFLSSTTTKVAKDCVKYQNIPRYMNYLGFFKMGGLILPQTPNPH
jgi:hypothetical protein